MSIMSIISKRLFLLNKIEERKKGDMNWNMKHWDLIWQVKIMKNETAVLSQELTQRVTR